MKEQTNKMINYSELIQNFTEVLKKHIWLHYRSMNEQIENSQTLPSLILTFFKGQIL